jgi:hypothetical protein
VKASEEDLILEVQELVSETDQLEIFHPARTILTFQKVQEELELTDLTLALTSPLTTSKLVSETNLADNLALVVLDSELQLLQDNSVRTQVFLKEELLQ